MNSVKILLVAVCAISAFSQVNSLEDGWTKFLGGKYIANSRNLNATWAEATRSCKQQGYELMAIETEEEHLLILSAFSEYITNRYWLGGSDFGSEGNFYWMSSGERLQFSAWHAGEPSGTNPTNGIKEDCMQYWNRNGTILWNDSPCENSYNYMCEYTNPCEKYPF